MGRRSKTKLTAPTSYTFSSLHTAILEEVSRKLRSKIWFNDDDDSDTNTDEYRTHVMGKFTCRNQTCPNEGWSSKKIAILIKAYDGNGYSAEVFNQRCKACNQLGELVLDERSYVERVAYRVQKWAGVRVARPEYVRKKGKPHERTLCEGCRRGVCEEGDD